MLELTVQKSSKTHNVVKLLISYTNVSDDSIKIFSSDSAESRLRLPDGKEYTKLPTILVYISNLTDSGRLLYPTDNITRALIDQWISLANKNDFSIYDSESIKIDSSLSLNTFIVGNTVSLADLVIFFSLSDWAKKSTIKEKTLLFNLSRWFNHIQHLPGLLTDGVVEMPTGATLKDLLPVFNNLTVTKKPKEPQASESRPVEDITRLSVRVGLVKEISRHPDADKIYCLKIDLSEDSYRDICSGLVEHLKPDEILNQKVCVLTNLKPKKIRGVMSNGMILCVSFEGKTELLQPPKESSIGELITWGDLKGEPDSVLSAKAGKNPFEAVQKDLVCKDKIGYYKNLAFSTSSGPCTCNTLVSGTIS